GKWGLGGPGSSGHPSNQGFDLFYGYLCQRVAHNYYPTHLWRNHDVDVLGNEWFNAHQKIAEPSAGFDQFIGSTYAPDKILAEAVKFVNENKDGPFFLYLPFVEPHLAMQPPQEWVDKYPAEWDESPYLGGKSYLPHPRPRAGYAAMISDLDEHVGTIVDLIDELGLAENTIIIFTSDNGPTHDVGGVDTEFFNSAGPLRGRKGSLYEGGIRVPMIARWPGRIEAGSVTDHISAFEDVMPTLARLTGAIVPWDADGASFLPTLLGDPRSQEARAYYVWEFHGYGGQKAVRMGKWKAVQRNILKGETKIELYDLSSDIAESNDVSADHPEIVARIRGIFEDDRTESAEFPMEQYDEAG
ncbi:MAG: sulfatase-like hydrolase/transferase, partial [Armatimonadetes bacterium]|nr:sulfatase-like hydrolase/transferase [Armatimonadota bacterium]